MHLSGYGSGFNLKESQFNSLVLTMERISTLPRLQEQRNRLSRLLCTEVAPLEILKPCL